MSAPLLMLLALLVEILAGWPRVLYAWIRHPVVWIGAVVTVCDKWLNSELRTRRSRRQLGVLTTVLVVLLTTATAILIAHVLPDTGFGYLVEVLIVASLLATRSMHSHVAAVLAPLANHDLAAARSAVSHIVGRDPASLDSSGIARATIESLAENTSDGVIAPLFWGVILGLPGIAAYKAINTLDSMIGHLNSRYEDFGWFSAKLDDVVNWLPARITAGLFIVASGSRDAISVVKRDARLHRSPNAGWPESAMAGALGVRLSGPRSYGGTAHEEPWVNACGSDPAPADVRAALRIYLLAMAIAALVLLGLSVPGFLQ